MEFGRVADVDSIDFKLPHDHIVTENILNKTEISDSFSVKIGCAKWGRTDWVGKLYPEGTKEKDFLQHYVQHFNSIELNATHYRIFSNQVVEKWYQTAPDGFVFCPKFYNGITHIKRLKNAEALTEAFLQSVLCLNEKLGPCFLQLQDNFTPKNADDVLRYLESLPKDFKLFIEFRHKDWFVSSGIVDDFYKQLQIRKTGLVLTDTAGRRDCAHMVLTVPEVFVRFVGNSLHVSDYKRIDEWVERIGAWRQKGLETLYFFMHQHDELYSPELIAYQIEQMNIKLGLGLQKPKLFNKNLF